MRDEIAFFGGRPLFDKPIKIVRPVFPDVSTFIEPFREALAAGQVTNNCKWVQEFERVLTAKIGVPTIVFSNGQLALMAMIRAAGVESGEVIVPSFTFSATPHAVKWCGAEPVFADIRDDGSFSLDPDDVERKITPRTVAIMGVDPYGIACDYKGLEAVGKRHGIKVIFDSAPGFGTLVDGKLTGGYGDAQIFSFHATKAFATMEGGCLCTNDREIMERAKAIRNFGQVNGPDCNEPGMNAKMMEISALIGLEQLKNFDRVCAHRRRVVDMMSQGLSKLPGLRLGKAPANQEPIWLYLPVVVDEKLYGLNRDQICKALEAEGLEIRKYYSPACHLMTTYKKADRLPLPVSEATAQNVIALPVFNDLTDQECNNIITAFTELHAAAPRIVKAEALQATH